MKSSVALLLLVLLAPRPASAAPERYELDPVHSRIVFLVSHAGFSRVEARVPIARLELGDEKWRKRILDPTFFDAEDFPYARFESTGVDASAAPKLRVTGTLELHGVRREVTLEADFNRLDRHPLTLRRTLGFSARTLLRRSDFGMLKWKNLVGDEVEVLIEIEATRKREGKPRGRR
jgi:polyisoprenoid-binding protein YceI